MTFIVKCAPVLREWNCCCCSCSMRAATTIFGWLKMLYALMQFMSSVVLLCTYEDLMPPAARVEHDFEFKVTRQMMIMYLVMSIINIIIYGLLLHGIHKKRPAFMLPYIFLQLVGLVVITLAIIVAGIFVTSQAGAPGLLIFLIGGIIVAVASFLWVIFYSYYRQLEDEKNNDSSHEAINYTYNMTSDQEKLADQPFPA